MTDTIIAHAEPVLVAIDISKARHEVPITVSGRKRHRRLTVLNQLKDFNRLIATLSEYGCPVRVAFENTGNYHRALAFRLGVAGFEVKLVSSVARARTREALSNSWDSRRDRGPSERVPLYFPEADFLHRTSRSDWFFVFLERYPSLHLISPMGNDAFIADAWTVVGRRVSKERLLADIYETARSSVGLPVDPDSDALRMFRMVLAEGRSLIAQRNAIQNRSVALLKDSPDCQLLTSIPGIGPINAL